MISCWESLDNEPANMLMESLSIQAATNHYPHRDVLNLSSILWFNMTERLDTIDVGMLQRTCWYSGISSYRAEKYQRQRHCGCKFYTVLTIN